MQSIGQFSGPHWLPLVSIKAPHGSPSNALGRTSVRARVRTPPPHDAVHGPYCPHCVRRQSTGHRGLLHEPFDSAPCTDYRRMRETNISQSQFGHDLCVGRGSLRRSFQSLGRVLAHAPVLNRCVDVTSLSRLRPVLLNRTNVSKSMACLEAMGKRDKPLASTVLDFIVTPHLVTC